MNKKCVYLGVTLFSAMILTSLSGPIVQADTANTNSSTNTVTSTGDGTKTAGSTTNSSASGTTTGSSTDSVETATTDVKTNSNQSATLTGSTDTNSTGTATGSTTNTVSTSSTGTNTNGSSTNTSGAGISLPASSIPDMTPTGNPTGTNTNTTTTPSKSYALPSNLTSDSVVNFADPTLAGLVKRGLGLKPTDNITVGDIENFPKLTQTLTINQMTAPENVNLDESQYTPIESLDGMQYLKLLPHDMIDLTVRLGSDAKADPDLTPLDGIDLNGLFLIGNFSNPSAKEISATQISQLNVPKYGSVAFDGDNGYNGIDNQDLKTIAPWVIKYTYNGQSQGSLMMNGNSISDFSPLKGVNTANDFEFNDTGGVFSSTPIYAVEGQPITFTSQPDIGIDGEDIASGYHFSNTVASSDLADDNLKNLGNDQYQLVNATPGATTLTYGDAGFTYGYNPDAITMKTYGTDPFINITIHGQPIKWQAHPNVTINYVDGTGKSIAAPKLVNGVTIGDNFDMTADSAINGYTITSPKSALVGKFTQDPQTITLTYKANPVAPKIPSSTGSTSTTNSTSSNENTATKPVITPENPKSRMAITIKDIATNGSRVDTQLAATGVKGMTTINGELFYLVGYGQLVAADDYDATQPVSGIARTFNSTVTLVDASGQPITRTLAANTAWRYSKIVTIKGVAYYQVATNEFLPVDSSVAFTPVKTKTIIQTASKALLYNSQGVSLQASLPAQTKWQTDGCAMINGVKMYRVASDEWVSSESTDTYQPEATIFHAQTATPVYDVTGKKEAKTLPAGTSWKTDRIVSINGQNFYRVASDEYVLVN